MSKKEDKKILEEIRKRVLAEEEAILEKKSKEMEAEANREALADITSLSREQVDRIAAEVRKETTTKKNTRRAVMAIVGTVIAVFAVYLSFDQIINVPQIILDESFDMREAPRLKAVENIGSRQFSIQ